MTHVVSVVLAAFFGGWSGFGRFFVLAGLILGVVNCLRFMAARPGAVLLVDETATTPVYGVTRFTRGPLASFGWPFLLVWLGFLVGSRLGTTVWAVLTGLSVFLVVVVGLRLVRAAHARRGDLVVAGPVVAVIMATTLLSLFGLLLVLRLAVVADPSAGVVSSLAGQGTAWSAVLEPVLLVLGVLVMGWWVGRGGPGWLVRAWTWLGGAGRVRADRVHLALLGVVALLYAAPLVAGGSHLTVLGLATPEYAKVLYLWVLAAMLADHAYGYRTRPRWSWRGGWRGQWRTRRHILYPILSFGLLAALSAAKDDYGPLIPMFAGTMAMLSFIVLIEVRRARALAGERDGQPWLTGSLRRVLRYSRPLGVPLVVAGLLVVVVITTTPKVSARGQTWTDPWAYPWAAACTAPAAGVVPPATPAGTVACQQSAAAARSSDQSQVAQSLAVIADGGLWGRGLPDTTSGRLPAGDTDFVLAVVWSKLGGLVVLLLAGLVALLGAALVRCDAWFRGASAGDEPVVTRSRLFTSGVAWTVLGQFLFVLAATVDAVPHSGITAPFLSRGGQSTVALALGVVWVLAVQYQSSATVSAPVPAPRAVAGRWWRRPPVPAAWAFLLSVLLTAGITVVPYQGFAADRPYCQTTAPTVDPRMCSTDRIAFDRATVRIDVDGAPQYVRDRVNGHWDPVGDPSVTLSDLDGLLQVGDRGGAVDLALSDVIDGSSSTSLRDRLLPPAGPAVGSVDLTIDPAIQHAAASALRADADGAGPLAGGIVVLDATSGHVLAVASAPTDTAPGAPTAVDQRTARSFADAHPYGVRRPDGSIDEAAPCTDATPPQDCARWQVVSGPASVTPAETADLRRYVDGDPTVDLPSADENRAVGRRYGLGSTFKVVIAATYLRRPGTTANDLIAAPTEINVAGQVIRNDNRGPCAGTVNGRISLTQALAVSCNSAFVALAEQLGWPAIRDTARDFGFVVGPVGAADTGSAWLAGADIGYDSRVPATADGARLGNDALGGGDVDGTPLQMAAVLGAVANGGVAIQPSLITSVTDPGSGTARVITGERRRVLTTAQAAQLRAALSQTTSPDGTARKLTVPGNRPVWVKTGTQSLYGDNPAPAGTFDRDIAWLVGFLDTATGPVAFAVAVETRDETEGGARARWLAQQVIEAITKVRQ